MKELILSLTVGIGVNFPTFSGARIVAGVAFVAFVAAVATDAAETGVADAADSITGSAVVVAAASSGAAVGAAIAGAGVGVETSGVEATTGAVTTETSGVAAIAGVEAGAAVAKAIAGDGVALADGDSTEMPVAAGATGISSGRAGVPVAFAFETMTSAGVGFTTASLAFGAGEGVCASANCVPSSVFTSTPGIGLGSIAGTDDSV